MGPGGSITGTHNLVEDDTCGSLVDGEDGNILNGNADLGELQDNGGPTETHALGPDSDAIDTGNNALALDPDDDPLEFDQRGPGFDRIVGGTVDIGAFEVHFVPGGSDVVESLFDGTLAQLQGNGTCDLREAIQAALDDQAVGECNTPPGGVITFADELLSAEGLVTEGTITLTAGQFPAIADATVVIDGDDRITLDADKKSRHFAVESSGHLAINQITLMNGRASGASPDDRGGSIIVTGKLNITGSTLSDNTATNGGAVLVNNYGEVVITDSTIHENEATDGGAIDVFLGGQVNITKSTLASNKASTAGGAIYASIRSNITITDSTVTDNEAAQGGAFRVDGGGALIATNTSITNNEATTEGGAVFATGEVTITSGSILSGNEGSKGGAIYIGSGGKTATASSTISGNKGLHGGGAIYVDTDGEVTITSSALSGNKTMTGGGGAIYVDIDGEVTITNSTLSHNEGMFEGGAIHAHSGSAVTITNSTLSGNKAVRTGSAIRTSGSVTLANTIVAGRTRTQVLCAVGTNGNITGTHNLIEDSSCGSLSAANNILNGNADLGELQDNGGPTETHALGTDSDAINAGNNDLAVDPDDDPLEFDQRGTGFPRIMGSTVDIGALEANQSDLSVTKVGPDEVLAGDEQLVYSVTVSNAGPSTALNVELEDELPAHTTFVSISDVAGWDSCAEDEGMVTCTVDELAMDASASFTLTLDLSTDAEDRSTISNTATVTSDTHDPDSSDNSSTAETTVINRADLSVTKTAAAEAAAGGLISYTIDVSNAGPSTALDVEWSDALPANTVFVALNAPDTWACTTPDEGQAGTVNCETASLAAGANSSFTLVAAIIPTTSHGAITANTATVAGTTLDPVTANNVSTVETEVANEASVTLSLIAPPVIEQGGTLIYSMSVANSGPNYAEGLTFETTLPDGTTFSSFSAEIVGWTCSTPMFNEPGDIDCTRPSLAPGEMRFMFLRVRVGETVPVGTTLTLTATVDHAVPGSDPSNLTRAVTTTVVEAVDPGEPGDPGDPGDGDTVVYELHFQWSLVTWLGEDGIAPGDALGELSSVVTAIYAWDAPSQTWRAYFPAGVGIPGANDLESLDYGDAYWIAINAPDGAEWETPAGAG